jgi:serine/threonine-protein phosphatase 2A regulatory subunit B
VISAVEFDSDGSFLATGDKGGRVVLFERVPMQQVRQWQRRRRFCRARAPAQRGRRGTLK